jgi:hypothetical protein
MSQPGPANGSIFEAEAFAALQRAAGCATATSNALTEAGNALAMTDPGDLSRQLGKAGELHRLFSARLAGVLRQLGEGSSL